MTSPLLLFRSRIAPAVLTGVGVVLVVLGLLSYGNSVEAGPAAVPEPTPIAVATSTPPAPSSGASPSPSAPVDRVTTRIVVPALRIDLPVVSQPGGQYPWCNVALAHDFFGPPGDPRGIYIYAHARKGMFLPILDGSQVDDGKKMLGMIVGLYTSDDQLFLYEIVEVRRHVSANFDLANLQAEGPAALWLQTSEGPGGKFPKLILKATLYNSGQTSHADAHPSPKPVVCG